MAHALAHVLYRGGTATNPKRIVYTNSRKHRDPLPLTGDRAHYKFDQLWDGQLTWDSKTNPFLSDGFLIGANNMASALVVSSGPIVGNYALPADIGGAGQIAMSGSTTSSGLTSQLQTAYARYLKCCVTGSTLTFEISPSRDPSDLAGTSEGIGDLEVAIIPMSNSLVPALLSTGANHYLWPGTGGSLNTIIRFNNMKMQPNVKTCVINSFQNGPRNLGRIVSQFRMAKYLDIGYETDSSYWQSKTVTPSALPAFYVMMCAPNSTTSQSVPLAFNVRIKQTFYATFWSTNITEEIGFLAPKTDSDPDEDNDEYSEVPTAPPPVEEKKAPPKVPMPPKTPPPPSKRPPLPRL